MTTFPTAGSLLVLSKNSSLYLLLAALFLLPACGGKIIKETEAEPVLKSKAAQPTQTDIPMWLGNPARRFYGSGPWSKEPLQDVWQVQRNWSSGSLYKEPCA